MGEKTCKLTNALYGWHLEVDGQSIIFTGRDNADYFENLYKRLGYRVTRDNDAYKREV